MNARVNITAGALIAAAIVFTMSATGCRAFAQPVPDAQATVEHPYRVSLPTIILPQLVTKSWGERTHTQHIEVHIKRSLDADTIVGLKLATWRLFQPMGIQWWDGLLDSIDSGAEFYPGHMRESGVGVSYQRMLWKGLFGTIEVLPLLKTYVDEGGATIQHGFKLYTSVHLGYHASFGRFFVEPQVHSQFWILDTNAPAGFKALDDRWRPYFLFEPNLYVGMTF